MSKILIKFFGYFFVLGNILSFSMSIILESPQACLFEKYGLQIFQKGPELSEFETSLKYLDFA